jgi:hypothetical protein
VAINRKENALVIGTYAPALTIGINFDIAIA